MNDKINIEDKYIQLEALARFGHNYESIDIFVQGVKWAIEELKKKKP